MLNKFEKNLNTMHVSMHSFGVILKQQTVEQAQANEMSTFNRTLLALRLEAQVGKN